MGIYITQDKHCVRSYPGFEQAGFCALDEFCRKVSAFYVSLRAIFRPQECEKRETASRASRAVNLWAYFKAFEKGVRCNLDSAALSFGLPAAGYVRKPRVEHTI